MRRLLSANCFVFFLLLPFNLSGQQIHEATSSGDIDAVRQLLAQGVNVNSKDRSGNTALHLAAINNHTDVAELLIRSNANVNERRHEWNTPLHDAIYYDHQEVAELLLAHGANVTDSLAISPLHLAVNHGRAVMVQLLLDHGADASEPLPETLEEGWSGWATQHGGRTPLEIAGRVNNPYVALLLRRQSGRRGISPEEVRALQGRLRITGYDPGPVDGALGLSTANAVREYQRDGGLDVDGEVTEALLRHVGESYDLDLRTEVRLAVNVYLGNSDLSVQGWQPHRRGRGAVRTMTDTKYGVADGFSLHCSGAGTLVAPILIVSGTPTNFSGHFRFGNLEINGCATRFDNGFLIRRGSAVVINNRSE